MFRAQCPCKGAYRDLTIGVYPDCIGVYKAREGYMWALHVYPWPEQGMEEQTKTEMKTEGF